MWQTFYGTKIPLSSLSHQHLSNITWYYKIVVGNDSTMVELYEIIRNKYGGIRLPYHPMISFTQEIDFLFNKGYITNKLDSDIIINGLWVGKLNYN